MNEFRGEAKQIKRSTEKFHELTLRYHCHSFFFIGIFCFFGYSFQYYLQQMYQTQDAMNRWEKSMKPFTAEMTLKDPDKTFLADDHK
jgi:hypothetical protein